MKLPFFRTDYHFWLARPEHQLIVIRAYTQAATASEARAIGRQAALASANVEGIKTEYVLGTTVPVPGVTAAIAGKPPASAATAQALADAECKKHGRYASMKGRPAYGESNDYVFDCVQ